MAAGKLQLHEDEGVRTGDGVLGQAEVALQSLALIPTQLTPPWDPRPIVAQWEHKVAKGGYGKLGALVRELGGGANHGEGSCWEADRYI